MILEKRDRTFGSDKREWYMQECWMTIDQHAFDLDAIPEFHAERSDEQMEPDGLFCFPVASLRR